MRDQYVHLQLDSKVPQTYCGVHSFGHKTTHDPKNMTCPNCEPVYLKTIMKKKENDNASNQPTTDKLNKKRSRGSGKRRNLKSIEVQAELHQGPIIDNHPAKT